MNGYGYRLVTNRDEHRERALALPPRWRELPGTDAASVRRRAIWPTDGAAGGTWVAAAEHGLTLTLLNLNQRPDADRAADRPGGGAMRPFGGTSRGLVIPRLIVCETPDDAAEALAASDLREFLPFRLIAVARGAASSRPRIVECRWDGARVGVVQHDGSPICFVSSGLGDWLVEPRLALFETLVAGPGATPRSQDAFHSHAWPDRPHLSVMMSRADARTVSVCSVEVAHGNEPGPPWEVRMDHRPIAEIPAVSAPLEAGVLR